MEHDRKSSPCPSDKALHVLVVEDDQSIARSVQGALASSGYRVSLAESVSAALEQVRGDNVDLVLTDFRFSEGSGLDVIRCCVEQTPPRCALLMSAYVSDDLALEALRLGAADVVKKPFSAADLVFALKKVEQREGLRPHLSESSTPESRVTVQQRFSFSNFIAKSAVMREIFETVKRLAPYRTTVLITGESGTGKELLVQALHYNSPRRGKPFVAVNCGAIPETLMESELFGHKRGAFTDATKDKRGLLEEAQGGTIFLDEIGEMPLHLQVKLLRALQEQQIRRVGDEQVIDLDIRVIAATLRDLDEDVRRGRFREDLYYRLNVISLHLPPLRERPEDIPLLVQHFTKKQAKRLGLPPKGWSDEALERLALYPWRGNVRELENCVERALVLSDGELIDVSVLPPLLSEVRESDARFSGEQEECDSLSVKQRTRQLEIELIQRALEKTAGNRTKASKILEISHRALLYKLKEYGLSEPSAVDERNGATVTEIE